MRDEFHANLTGPSSYEGLLLVLLLYRLLHNETFALSSDSIYSIQFLYMFYPLTISLSSDNAFFNQYLYDSPKLTQLLLGIVL